MKPKRALGGYHVVGDHVEDGKGNVVYNPTRTPNPDRQAGLQEAADEMNAMVANWNRSIK